MIDFASPPLLGTVLKLDDQAYELRALRPHQRLDGTSTQLLVWETNCPSCGAGFEQATGLKASGINRRCPECRKAGKPVKGRRGRKVKLEVLQP